MCIPPESPYDREPPYYQTTPHYPDQPQTPQIPHEPAPVTLEEKTPEELNVVQPEGDVATLRCYATGYPLPTISWLKRGSVAVCRTKWNSHLNQ